MRQELIRVHNDNDRLEERLAAVEAQLVAQAEHARGAGAPRSSHPPLRVVQLVPQEETDLAATDAHPVGSVEGAAAKPAQDTGPRPMIKGTGQKVYNTAPVGAASNEPAKAQPSSGGK